MDISILGKFVDLLGANLLSAIRGARGLLTFRRELISLGATLASSTLTACAMALRSRDGLGRYMLLAAVASAVVLAAHEEEGEFEHPSRSSDSAPLAT
jgi:hypothetical protein